MPLKFLCLIVLTCLLCSSCSRHISSKGSQIWHSFSLKYNALYNAQLAFEATREKQTQNPEGLYLPTRPLEIYDRNHRDNYQHLIERLEYAIRQHSLRQKPRKRVGIPREQIEFNPTIHKAWLLLGEAQFYSMAWQQASETFSHIRWLYKYNPSINHEALIWQLRCFVALGRSSDADIFLHELKLWIDTQSHKPIRHLWHKLLAEYHLSNKDFVAALPYLKLCLKQRQHPEMKSRLYYTIALCLRATDTNREAASQYYKRASRYTQQAEIKLAIDSASRSNSVTQQHLATLPSKASLERDVAKNKQQAPYPIDWSRIYINVDGAENRSGTTEVSPKTKESPPKLILRVGRESISKEELFFLLSVFNFKRYTQYNIRLSPYPSVPDKWHTILIEGLVREEAQATYSQHLIDYLKSYNLSPEITNTV